MNVKICGLSRAEDIDAANRALPDFIGFVFAQSRRRVDAPTAARLRSRLDARIRAVGVFVNQDMDEIARLCRDGVIDWAQLHGDEDDGYIARLKARCGLPVIKAVGVDGALPTLPREADYLLFDTAAHSRGGSGTAFDWSILEGYEGPPYFLAGGLDATNVARAASLLKPYCLDVSSGVETGGVKDAGKIARFVRIAREMS